MQNLANDVERSIKQFIGELEEEVQQSQDKLHNEVSGLLFDTINNIPNEADKDIPTQQRIAYLTGKIDTLKNLVEDFEKFKNDTYLKIEKYKII